MNTTMAGVIFVVSLVAALALCYRPLGDYMCRVVHQRQASAGRARHLPAGRGQPGPASRPGACTPAACWRSRRCRSCSCTCSSGCRTHLSLNLGFAGVRTDIAWNTAVSFVTNTNWQSYSGESTMGHLVQMAGLAVQNFVSAAVGIAVAVALVRGFARAEDRPARQLLGRPDPDLYLRILLPVAVVAAVVLVAGGVVQNLSRGTGRVTGPGGRCRHITGGPVASPGGDQGARHQRRRLLQRQLGAPVREPDRVDELAGDLPAAGHPVQPAAGVRPDGRRRTGRATRSSR